MTSLIELLNWFDDKDKVLVSLSGGVDSALVAYAANKKLGKNAEAQTLRTRAEKAMRNLYSAMKKVFCKHCVRKR